MIKLYIVYPFIFVVMLMFSFKVFAEQPANNKDLFVGPVWENFCQVYISHKPQDNVEYKAGVDIHGKSIVGADLQEPVIKTPKMVEFDLDINLAKYLGINAPRGLLGEAKMASIRIEDGIVYFNGKKVENAEQIPLHGVCSRMVQRKLEKNDKPSYTNLEIFKHKGKHDDSTIGKTAK